MAWQRPDGRTSEQLRPIAFEFDFSTASLSSVLVTNGNTKVLCSVSTEAGVPHFLQDQGQGWLTAEYRMLPGATLSRHGREFLKLSGRTQEIQRLIGRSLRAALDLTKLGDRTLYIDADVIQADAGTRTTAIVGGWVALTDAIVKLQATGALNESPLHHAIAAVSVGLVGGEPLLDLKYEEDIAASVDFNVVMNEQGEFIEVQGTAEAESFSRSQLNALLDLAAQGIDNLRAAQYQALRDRGYPESFWANLRKI